jgi:Tol biopolymer transport system component
MGMTSLNTIITKGVFAVGIVAATLPLARLDGHAQTRRAMTVNDLLTAVRVTQPALSPDGRLVAYVRTTTDLASGKRNGDIYVVPGDGSAAPTLLAGGGQAESPQFSPDSRRVAFISGRDGAPQDYVVGVEGGEPKQVTKLSGGALPPLSFRRMAAESRSCPTSSRTVATRAATRAARRP